MTKRYTPTSAAADVEAALRLLEGRWKLVILFHLFGGELWKSRCYQHKPSSSLAYRRSVSPAAPAGIPLDPTRRAIAERMASSFCRTTPRRRD